jgi:hypothetical protein
VWPVVAIENIADKAVNAWASAIKDLKNRSAVLPVLSIVGQTRARAMHEPAD